jgi:hypothetical protein
VTSTSPVNLASNIAVNTLVTATFSEDVKASTVVGSNFTVMNGLVAVPGVVTYDLPTKTATFASTVNLIGSGTVYTATIKKAVQDAAGNSLAADKVWTFTTTVLGLGPAPVVLGTAGNFVILAKTAVSNVPTSAVTGNIGLSPAATSFVTGFSLIAITGGALSAQVVGLVQAADMAPPTPANLTAAVLAMQTAYTDAAGRPTPTTLNLGAGNIGGLTLTAGLYKWTTGVTVPLDVTFSGSANDVWILQIPGTLSLANAKKVLLSGGAQAKNIIWQVAGNATLGTTSHFEGIILGQTSITLQNGATMVGAALAQTAVSLDHATISKAN